MYKRVSAGLILLLAALPALAGVLGQTATAGLQVQSFEAGIFQAPAVQLEEGERLLNAGGEEIVATRAIPAELGVKFGIRFTLAGKAPGNRVKYLYLTPGVVHPDGARHDKYEVVRELSVTAGFHLIAFQFTEEYEIVPGEWQFMVFEGDRLLLKESFAVGVSESKLSAPPAAKPKTLESVIRAVE